MTTATPPVTRKPRDDEIDIHALTHQGRVRITNQDHFLLASVHRRVQIVSTSLSDRERLPFGDERLAYVIMVADGVGGGNAGERASATALEIATQYVVSSMNCYYSQDSTEADFINALQAAAMKCHEEVVERAKGDPDLTRMATTLTMLMGVWPWYYLLQVGDSRYYLFRDGKLRQMTRDQTIAQDLLDQGVFTAAVARRSRFSNVLSSSIGGEQTEPRITRLPQDWNNVHLLCSDGLTKHVSDERIAERLGSMTSAREACELLLQDALEDGGTDNITIVIARATPKD
ncbi:MAG TPA: protein phosphatase 2C domain-containing protein [Gemmatimonadaceae bacterium]|nr:protein phosphatase 2C domain-containing protein [Gemmatimonadaceae bacterium]